MSIDEKISNIRQIAVMTDAGIAINESLAEVAEHTENKQLGAIFAKINAS